MKKIILGSVVAGMILVGCGGENYLREIAESESFEVCKDELSVGEDKRASSLVYIQRIVAFYQCFKREETKKKIMEYHEWEELF